MADYEFQFHIARFRILGALRQTWRTLFSPLPVVRGYLSQFAQVLLVVCVGPIWFSFETLVRSWTWIADIAQKYGYRVSARQRLIFCVCLMLIAGHLLLLFAVGWGISPWSFLVFATYGVVVHRSWSSGARWARHILGIRLDRGLDL